MTPLSFGTKPRSLGQKSHKWLRHSTYQQTGARYDVIYILFVNSANDTVGLIGQVCVFVCSSVCERVYCKSNQPISLKLNVIIRPTNSKNRLTFGGDLIPNTDSGLLPTSLSIAE